jgi:hypothetical protein
MKNFVKSPIFIIARNRFTPISNFIKYIERNLIENRVYIFDMASTYPPLLDFYDSSSNFTLVRLDNLGPRLLWKDIVFKDLASRGSFFLTDGDLDFSDTDPNVFKQLFEVSSKYPGFRKVGSALRIDDLPKRLNKSQRIIESELDNWGNYRSFEKNKYLAPIDTTFAYYPKYTDDFYHWPAIRLAGKYSVRHIPWYVDYDNLDIENRYYIENAKTWGTHGTSSERGKRENDLDPKSSKLFKYSFFIKIMLILAPRIGSRIINILVSVSNLESKIS